MKRKALGALALLVLIAACAPAGTYALQVEHDVAVTPVLNFDVFSPIDDGSFPAVVLFHGGSWYGGQRENVESFAAELAETGLTVYNATYTVGGNGGGWPTSYEDVRCALSAATNLSDGAPLTIVGHSAGAHLAATVALSGDTYASDRCEFADTPTVAAFVGIAGPYEADRYGPLLVNWFGTSIQDDPSRWEAGSPYGYVASAPKIPIRLFHGDADQVVQLAFSDDFQAELAGAGFDATLTILEEADHASVIDPLLDAPAVVAGIKELALLVSD